jgi:peptidoglycan L-alanyl-D-glutamate endopeptidase CwlK
MPSRSKADLNEILVDAYEKACDEYSRLYPDLAQPFLTCTFRSNDEQTSLYAIGRTKQGRKVTNAQAGQSAHNYKPAPAFDIAFVGLGNKLDWNNDLFKKFAEIITKIQPLIEWGGGWKFVDRPHFQLKDWRKYVHA